MMLEDLLRYTAIADQKMVDVFAHHPNCGEKAIMLFSHILNAQHIWIHRILYKPTEFERLQVHFPEMFQMLKNKNTAELQLIFQTLPLERQIEYSTADGTHCINPIEEILYHVVNHSTYHRGQVASQFKQQGINPPLTDFILFKRTGEL